MRFLIPLILVAAPLFAQLPSVTHAIYSADGGAEIVLGLKSPDATVTGYVVSLQWEAQLQSETVTRIVWRDAGDTAGNSVRTRAKFFVPASREWVRITRILLIPIRAGGVVLLTPGVGDLEP